VFKAVNSFFENVFSAHFLSNMGEGETEGKFEGELWDYLPDDVIAFTMCLEMRNMARFALVSKRWYDITKSPYVW
jgi:hypothetical protein